MKAITALCLALTLCLTGCADSHHSEPEQTDVTVSIITGSETSEQTETTAETTENAEPEITLPKMNAPLEPLAGISLEGTVSAAVCRGTTAAVQCVSGKENRYYIVDFKDSRLISSGTFRTADERLVGLSPSGEAVSFGLKYNDYDGSLNYYDTSETPRTAKGHWLARAVYDPRSDRVIGYDYEKNAVMQMNGSGEEQVFIQLSPSMFYLGCCTDRRVLMLTEQSDNPALPRNAAAYSLDSGIRLGRITYIDNTEYAFSGGMMLREYLDYDPDTDASSYEVRTSRFMDETLSSGYQLEDKASDHQFDYVTNMASPYALSTEGGGDSIRGLIFADFKAGTRAVQPFADNQQAAAVQFCFSQETGRWLTAASFMENGKTVTRLMMTEPRLAEQTETFLPVTSLSQIPEQKQCALYLEGARGLADKIAEKYGIRILIGDEVLNIQDSGSSWTSVEALSSEMKEDEIAAETVLFLKQLEARLAVYPKGFFSKFRDEYGEGGLLILLTDQPYTDTIGPAGGVQFLAGKWYSIALERNGYNHIHHELWHAVEARISAEDPKAFLDENNTPWLSLQPKGFSFTQYAESYDSMPRDYFLSETDHPQDAYFARRYSAADSREDRATLIEWLFYGNSFYENLGEENKQNWELLPLLPHIKAKLDYMAERTKKVFSSVYWEEIMQNGYDYDAILNMTFTPYP